MAKGYAAIAVVSDQPEKYTDKSLFAQGVTFHHRDALDQVQRELREVKGTSVLIYDQTCAAEKRRRRKKGKMEDPSQRVFINLRVCEGCGDCSVQSNCLSILPKETEFGRKREIDQSACNKDFSCLRGFCPSFVTVHGGTLRKPTAAAVTDLPALPSPQSSLSDNPYDILITGVGGTGVVTIGALLGMAAHLEGKGCSVLDMTGLAQKFGAVVSHVRIAEQPEDIHAVRIAAGGANLLLGCDLVVAAGSEALSKLDSELSHAVVNTFESMPAAFTRNPDLRFPTRSMEQAIDEASGDGKTHFVNATRIAGALMGDSIAANLFMVGYAFQKGLIPLSAEAIEQAIAINGVAVEFNCQAFAWGRQAAHDSAVVERLITPVTELKPIATTLEDIVARRVAFLTDYQSAGYAKRYQALVDKVRQQEAEKTPGRSGLAEAVARYYFKLLAYKDEYEVARLYTDGEFLKELERQFEGDYSLEFHLAPPLLGGRDPHTGHLQKRRYGPRMMKVFKLVAKFKRLRGTPLDIFGYSAERRQERQLIKDYQQLLKQLLAGLNQDNHEIAVELASIPEHIRGYGHVKEDHLEKAKARETELLNLFRNPPKAVAA